MCMHNATRGLRQEDEAVVAAVAVIAEHQKDAEGGVARACEGKKKRERERKRETEEKKQAVSMFAAIPPADLAAFQHVSSGCG